MAKLKARSFFLFFHRYLGLSAGLIFIILGITGSLLVFTEEIDQFFHPNLLSVQPPLTSQSAPISPQTALDLAQEHYPDLTPHRLIIPQRANQVYVAMMQSKTEDFWDVYLNPYTGQILGTRLWKQSLGGFLIELHVHLLSGDTGSLIVGLTGLGFFIMALTGLMLWNGWRNLKSTLKIRWRSSQHLKQFDIHKVVGVISSLGLILLAFTGAAMIFWTPFETLVYKLTGETPAPDTELHSQVRPQQNPLSLDVLTAQALEKFPQAKLWKAFPAKKPDDPVNLWLLATGENAFNRDISLYFDQYTGQVLKLRNAKNDSFANRIIYAQYILHIGHFGGSLTRVLYGLIGLTPIILLGTGLVIFRHRLRRWLARKTFPAS